MSTVEQVCRHLFLKVADIVLQSRIHDAVVTSKTNTDFNLECGETYNIRPEADKCFDSQHRALLIDVYTQADTATTILNPNSRHGASKSSSKLYVVLERWKLSLEREDGGPASVSDITNVPSASMSKFYKHLIVLIRTVYTTTRLLPLFRVFKHNKECQGSGGYQGRPELVRLSYAITDCGGPLSSGVFDGVPSKILEFDAVEGIGLRVSLSVRYRDDVVPPTLSAPNATVIPLLQEDIIADYITPQPRSRSHSHPTLPLGFPLPAAPAEPSKPPQMPQGRRASDVQSHSAAIGAAGGGMGMGTGTHVMLTATPYSTRPQYNLVSQPLAVPQGPYSVANNNTEYHSAPTPSHMGAVQTMRRVPSAGTHLDGMNNYQDMSNDRMAPFSFTPSSVGTPHMDLAHLQLTPPFGLTPPAHTFMSTTPTQYQISRSKNQPSLSPKLSGVPGPTSSSPMAINPLTAPMPILSGLASTPTSTSLGTASTSLPGQMQPPRPQRRVSGVNVSAKALTNMQLLSQIFAVRSGSFNPDSSADGLGFGAKSSSNPHDNEDAFAFALDDGGLRTSSVNDVEMTISALVRHCDNPPRLLMFLNSPAPMSAVMQELDRLHGTLDVMTPAVRPMSIFAPSQPDSDSVRPRSSLTAAITRSSVQTT